VGAGRCGRSRLVVGVYRVGAGYSLCFVAANANISTVSGSALGHAL